VPVGKVSIERMFPQPQSEEEEEEEEKEDFYS